MTTVQLPHSVLMQRLGDMSKSIIQKEQCCYLCGTTLLLEEHHIFRGPNRKVSERLGLKVWLCKEHHTGQTGVHNNQGLNGYLQKLAQRKYEETHTREEFMQEIGKNYLEE